MAPARVLLDSTRRPCRPRAAAAAVALFASCMAAGAASLPEVSFATVRNVAIGQGILAPIRLLASPIEDVVYVATGRGESYPEGFLHELDARTFTELRPRIEVGRNVSDLVSLGGRLLVLSRGDSTLTLVDPVSWKQLDRIDAGLRPTAAAPLGPTVAAVGSISAEELVIVSRHGAKLAIERRIPLDGRVTDLAVAKADNMLYVAITGVGVVAYDIATWSETGRAPIPGSLGKGAIVWRGYVIVSNRDGYVHFVDRSTFAVTTIDVAESLGIPRESLPLRGIDCTDVISVGGNRVAVINVRQDSLVYEITPTGPTAKAVARFSKGVYGAYLRNSRRLVLAQSDSNSLLEIRIPATIPASGNLATRQFELGTEIRSARLLGGSSPAVAALDSRGAIHIVAGNPANDHVLTAGAGLRWLQPLIMGPGDTLGILQEDAAGRLRYVLLERDGTEVFSAPVVVPSVYSAIAGNGELALVSRLSHQVQLVRLDTGSSRVITLDHDRSRLSAPVGQRRWIVFHDTVPDIGWTVLRSDHTSTFFSGGAWVAAVLPLSPLQIATVSFSGSLGLMNVDGRYERRSGTGISGSVALEAGASDDLWVTSEHLGSAYRVPLETLRPVERLDLYGLLLVGALPGTNRLAIATTRALEIARVNAPR